MNDDAFGYIYGQTFVKAAREILMLIGEKSKRDFGFSFDDSQDTRKDILEHYNFYNDIVYTSFMHGMAKDGVLIDTHKIIACLAKAVLDVSPLHFDGNKDVPWAVMYSNYQLCFFGSIHAIRFFLKSYYKYRVRDKNFYMRFTGLKNLKYPQTTIGHDVYWTPRGCAEPPF
ncbi:MAG: hypothetical protein J6O55_02710 [Lachnospiraceae bacterium]|nr:hypothetical protein [Lachnospiraceae bacterium]